MPGNDSIADSTTPLHASQPRLPERRAHAVERGGGAQHHDLPTRIHRHHAASSPLLAAAVCFGAWAAAALATPGQAGTWIWAGSVTVLSAIYLVLSHRAPPGKASSSGLLVPAVLVATMAVLGLGLALMPAAGVQPDGRVLSLIALGTGAAAVPVLVLRPPLLVAAVALCTLPVALSRLGGPSADPASAVLLLVAGLIVVVGGIRLGAAYGRALRNDVEQRALLRRLEETNQALSADRVALQTESRTDPLTGLANRRYLEESLRAEWNRCRRSGAPLSCVMLDIDHFKAYNDHYGHDGGDLCLRRIAAVLSDSTRRAGDVVARYGGEEFVVLLPETGGDGATTVAELLRRAVEQAAIPHANSPLGPVVTVSMGVATLVPDRQQVPGELLKAADLALYEAKGAGRNRVVMADGDTLDSARMAARGLIG